MEEINIIMLKNFWFIHLISANVFFPLINSIVSEFKYNKMYLNTSEKKYIIKKSE